jgi:hypothetical protein
MHFNSRQKGAALFIIIAILALMITSVMLFGLDKNSLNIARDKKTNKSLAKAKEVLINYALLSDKLPSSPGIGYLPCPDLTGDGLSNEPCGLAGESEEGWLPWQTLGEKTLYDKDKTCLRYVVSGNYKINPSTVIIKAPPTQGHFVIHDENNVEIVGATPINYALALIVAPHRAVSGQTRGIGGGSKTTCGSSAVGAQINRATNLLDTLNNVNNAAGTYSGPGTPGNNALPTSLPSVFMQANSQNDFNDALIWVNPQDFANVYARMP